MKRSGQRLVLLIGSAMMVGVGACHSDRTLPSPKDAGGRPAGVSTEKIHKSAGPAECDASPLTTCFVDTAQQSPGAIPGENYPEAQWIFFAATGDSIVIAADTSASLTTNFGAENVGRITASFFHKRLAREGVLTVNVYTRQFPQGEPPAYAIRFQQLSSSASAPLRPTGQRAFLTIGSANDAGMFAVFPLSKAQGLVDASSWQVRQGDYRVALVADSLYVVCRKECSIADTLRLRPGERSTAFR